MLKPISTIMRTKTLFLIIGISFLVLPIFSQTSYEQLKNKIDTIKIDSTTFGEVYGTQLDEIFMDMKQINNALTLKSDSLTKVIANMQDTTLKNDSKNKLYFYAALVLAFLTVLFALLWFIFMMKANKRKKIYQETSLEIGKCKAEIEKLNAYLASEKEQHQYALEMLENEKNKVISEYKQLIQKLEQTQQTLQQKENELTQVKTTFEQTIEQYKQEKQHLQSELSQQVTKNEETALIINELKENERVKNEQINNLESEIKNLIQTKDNLLVQIDELKKNSEDLQQQIIEANLTKEKVNEELKKFVEELQTMLPLPKR
ncbi:MAG: hypothetical protein HPY79_07625 [Bacteroidales bacterium]|nr:hypothetical protein [Bacteroidales bacterium]